MKILFTGGGGAGNEAIWRIMNKDFSLYFADMNINNIHPKIPKNRRIKILPAKNKNFIKHLSIVSKKYKFDYIVPGVDEELFKLSNIKNQKKLPNLILPENYFIKLMLNKLNCFIALKKERLNIPKTTRGDKIEKLIFPQIIKPIYGRGSFAVEKVNNYKDITAYKKFYKIKSKKLILQKFIAGQEYTVFVYSNKKTGLIKIIPIKIINKKGITIEGITQKNKKIINFVKQFDKIFTPNGPYNIQCIQKSNGDIYPFEINPRISTTFCLALKSGFNFKDAINKKKTIFNFKSGIKLKRSWNNYFIKK